MTATVLVVDDIAVNRKLLEAKLLSEYYTVLTADSAENAFKLLKKDNVDIILLDVMMPGMDGIKACKKIKEDPSISYIPVVMVTALAEVKDRVAGLEAGADEFLTKPIDDLSLFARVKSLTRMKLVLDELKLRGQTSEELGVHASNLNDDFTQSRLVILDDDIVQSKNVVKLLKNIVGEINTFDDADDFEQFLNNHKADVIMISCQISDMDPLKMCVILRAKDHLRHSPVILIAEEDKVDIVRRGLEIGANDYFITPVDNNELIARVKTQLRRKSYIDNLKNDLEQNFNLSLKDGLTNIFNRRYFDIHANLMVNKARKLNESLSIMMIDIDDFKLVNDKYGHQVGDLVIKSIVNLLKYNVRITDLIARYGGDEFVIIIPNLPDIEIYAIAERLQKVVENANLIIGPNESIKKTISIGVANYKNQSVEQLINEADTALYEAKNAGKNKIFFHSKD